MTCYTIYFHTLDNTICNTILSFQYNAQLPGNAYWRLQYTGPWETNTYCQINIFRDGGYNMYWSTNIFCQVEQYVSCQQYVGLWPKQYISRFNTSPSCARQCILLRSMPEDPCAKDVVVVDVLLWTIRIELPSSNYYSLGRWPLFWKAGCASCIGGGISILHLMYQQYDNEIPICQRNTHQYVLNLTICWSTSQHV